MCSPHNDNNNNCEPTTNRYPVEKEKALDASVFLRFAACGAACGSTAHAFLIPLDVVKTRMQSEPRRYPDVVSAFKTLVEEEVCARARGGGGTYAADLNVQLYTLTGIIKS